ncbi:MAG: SDR family NAD(P)-dependent oxidoreductase [Ignavibacteriaceae bacterium]
MKLSFKNKWALVTGSSRGIGRQIAMGLAERGCNVVIHARLEENLTETQMQLKKYDVKVIAAAGNLETSKGTDEVINKIKKFPGYLDILYNNAAVSNDATPITNFSVSEWMKTFSVNLFAMVKLCNEFAPIMKQRGFGRIINLTSGIADQPQYSPYSVSKAAVDKFSRDLAYAFRNDNVLVNYLDPGWLKTDLGGPDAWNEVETVLPGALVPALLEDNGPTGKFYCAQDFKYLK